MTSDNIGNGTITFNLGLEVYPDASERDGDKGTYKNGLNVVVTEPGEHKANATIKIFF